MSENSSSKTNFLLGFFSGLAVLSVVAFFVLLGITFSNRQEVDLGVNAGDSPIEQPTQEPVFTEVPPINENDYVFGNKNAKVTVIEYTDFECPFCSRHYETAKQIKAKYGNKIAFVTRNFPLSFHPEAQKSAEASECAGEQGKFWKMYDVLFEANLAGDMSIDKWKAEAKKMGLNTSKFNDCLDSGKYAKAVADEAQGGGLAGVTGTPATYINGEMISGALPFEDFVATIDGLLAE